ncbi:hypothetical protein Javan117_0005 [Streptococcus phage Javan117]|uniref:Uncharacterized protein n=1 Tax=Streptococcus phage Javan128 TaxID=2547993 RepID=A0ACD6BAA1_9CAUD|nr:hypothetical protein [Streptococcus dysgalactiae]QBX13985.1 hypothetical protein Javan117_0005 [Streptococcus phage Javan117]QBX23430.1 hypothetical protein Javan128_0056 [Streptococcus phage Javan128]OCW99254.1 hypothetical protein BBG10_01465 [Streptococcus dysgalactiae subsp. equisimilis]SQB83337.1 Uncharacterised protein [Streptococcus dysgalactiae]GET71022.1 hypothetical protein KNZ03_15810 [Streptococcus dysgalactiae subsp. equisimilis]
MKTIFTKKQTEELLNDISIEKQKELFNSMHDFRSQHAKEARIPGWSDKYNKLEKKMLSDFEEVTGIKYDTLESELIWDNLSNKFLYNS